MTFLCLLSSTASLRAPALELAALPPTLLQDNIQGLSDSTTAAAELMPVLIQSTGDFMTRYVSSIVQVANPPPPAPDLFTTLSTIALVTASDMVPFVPCQPLAIALGSKLGLWAFPICVTGQCLAGVLAFQAARAAADSDSVRKVLDSLGEDGKRQFEEFRKLGTDEGEGKVLLTLIGLRLAPFFPFSAGNYLLGGATGVSLRPFIVATLFGCLLSNFLSISVGIGGAELWQQQQQQQL